MKNLSKIHGTYTKNHPLADLTTVKVGGPAEVFATFTGWDDLVRFLTAKPDDMPLTIIGAGSNALISDVGLSGVITHLGRGFDAVEIRAENMIYAEAGASCGKVARAVREESLAGLAFYAGIPGSIGGALKMNAGCYGSETFDFVKEIHVLTDKGEEKILTPDEIEHGYRHTVLPAGWIFKGAVFQLHDGDRADIKETMRRINRERTESQPIGQPSSGSWFRNPTVDGKLLSAWKVTEEAGCRGLQVGGAQVSEKHANFFINTGGATAADFVELSRQVEAKILETQGIKMHREVRYLGFEDPVSA